MSESSRYILSKKIARGGMAEIFLGLQVGEDGFQRVCAVKRILPHYAQDQEFVQMFRDEAHICKRLHHGNIVRVEGFEEVEGSYAIIMEFIDGVDLRTLLHTVEQSKKRLSIPQACYIIAEAARGLHFAHCKVDEITNQPLGIVHRDVSPQNILISYEGEVKITDFGIADAENKLTETRPGIVKGKYSYMSPEQISAKAVDARTDVFAMSIVLWEMLAMRRLFQGENEVDTIQRVKNCKIEFDIRELNREIDEELDLILKRGLAKDPRKRYKSAADFEKDLRRYMSRKHPDFTPEDLGSFLKQLMEGRRAESAADIKRTLTETNQRPGRHIIGKKRGGPVSHVEVALDDASANAPRISVALDATKNGVSKTGHSGSLGHSSLGGSGRMGHVTGYINSGNGSSNSGLGRLHSTRNSGQALPMARQRLQQNKLWMLGSLAAGALCLALVLTKVFPAQTKPANLTLISQPARVKLIIDGKPYNRGRYVLAANIPQLKPLRLSLPRGRHSIMVSRPGYVPYVYELDADAGASYVKDDIVLKEKEPLAALRINLKNSEHAVKFDIENGYFVGVLNPKRQITQATPDLFVGTSYQMRVASSVASEKPFICRFTPRSDNWREADELWIDRKARKCTIVRGGGD